MLKFVPKSQQVWIFGNVYGYKDNACYVYEYLVENKDTTIRPIWINKSKKATALGENYYCYSLKGLYYQSRAAVAVLTTGMNDGASFALSGALKVQLWHGIPIKKLLLDSNEASPFPNRLTRLNKLFMFILKMRLSKYSLVIAADKKNQLCLSQAFGLPIDRVKVTGLPRHDVIWASSKSRCVGAQQRILYAPTWHGNINEARQWVYEVLTSGLLAYCHQNQVNIDVSIHPLNGSLRKEISDLKGVSLLDCEDINKVLGDYDLLITDYSSIAFDFSVLNRPVVFSCAKIQGYATERGIYEDYISMLDKQSVTGSQLILNIDALLNGKPFEQLYSAVSVGSGRARTVEEIKRLL
ncbi:CDP-glycerol glycerophosphotransferase family protein [Thaumasiovibrio sp. DFM-14]|uniref:CDP-glycerol glycerophosphotransferase family protein n=1 Tax=Thaumasiovibrio sp. DFM-14 TaxID=3384792 RepID=UPI00399F7917